MQINHKQKKNSNTDIKINEFAQKIEKIFVEQKLYYDVWYDTNSISIEIRNGDWKHDHLYAKHLVKELAKKEGVTNRLNISEEITEDSQDDSYSAIHIITFHHNT